MKELDGSLDQSRISEESAEPEIEQIAHDIEELEHIPIRSKSRCCSKWICIGCTVIILAIVIILWESHSKPLLESLKNTLSHLVKENKWYCNLSIMSIQMIFSWVPVPGCMYLDIFLVYLMKEFWRPFLLFVTTNLIGAHIIFWLIRLCLREKLNTRWQKYTILKAIKFEVRTQPWAASFMINSLMIPMPIKNFCIPLTDLTYPQFAGPHVVFHLLINCLIVYTGLSIVSINNSIKNSHETTVGQKVAIVIQATLTIGSLVAMCVIGAKLYKRFKQFKDEETIINHEMTSQPALSISQAKSTL